jgi:hypothetical protein
MPPIPDPVPIEVDRLLLDDRNPRLPETLRGARQDVILAHMLREYDLLRLAHSIATYGYYPSEPLIAISEGRGKYRVVEGNRRLATILTLRQPPAKAANDSWQTWKELSERGTVPDRVPVVVAGSRSDVAPIIGYRHIAGIEPWDAWAKARYIAESESDVRSHYRNYHITREAKSRFRIDTLAVEESFGVFTRAMNSPQIRDFIDAPQPRDVKPGKPLLKARGKEPVAELFGWLFGENPAIAESRDISRLGRVIGSESGLAVLRRTGDLNEAEFAAGGKRDRLVKRLSAAQASLEKASDDIKAYHKDPEIVDLLEGCKTALKNLLR